MDDCAGDVTIRGIRDAAIISLLRATGIRRAELARLDRRDFDARAGTLHIVGKFAAERTGYLWGAGKRAVNRWLKLRGDRPGPLFYPVYNDGAIRERRMGHFTVHKMLQTRSARCGIPRVNPHDFRRTFISDLLESGVDLLLTQQLAGHCFPQSTMLYDYRGEEHLAAAVRTIRIPYRGTDGSTAKLKAALRNRSRQHPRRPLKRRTARPHV